MRCRKELKLNSDGCDSGSKNASHAVVAHIVGSGEVCGLESGGRSCVGVFSRNLASVAVKKFYKYTFSAVCKDNAGMNFITFKHKRFIPLNFDEWYDASTYIKIPNSAPVSIVS